MNPTISQSKDYVGGLSKPSKMPCYGYSLPAKECGVGSRLRQVKGSTCASCYAMRGNYAFPKIQDALYKRLDAISRPDWVLHMSFLINHYGAKTPYFRWHDSGDLQSVEHLQKIVEVVRNTPSVKHWLPTREYAIVKEFRKTNSIPNNLTVRLSAHMVEGPDAPNIRGTVKSAVHKSEPRGHVCPAPKQDNTCGQCRACWDATIPLVSYHKH